MIPSISRHLQFLFLFVLSMQCFAGWNKETQFKFWLGLDDNVFESLSHTEQDKTGRLALVTSCQGRKSNWLLGMQYVGAFEGYSSHSSENRMIHSAAVNYSRLISSHAVFNLQFNGRIKDFFQEERGYRYGDVSPGVTIAFNPKYKLCLGYSYALFDYQYATYFDYAFHKVLLHATLKLSSNWRWNMGAAVGQYQYDRDSYRLGETENQNSLVFVPNDEKQKDDYFELRTEVEGYGWALFKMAVGYWKKQSNNYGYSSTCPFFECTLGKTVVQSVSISIRTVLQWLQYEDDLAPLLLVRPDSESEECSAMVMEISKHLPRNQAVRFRFGIYENESPFRNRFYHKNILSLGYTCRF